MTNNSSFNDLGDDGATVVITHRVKDERQAEYNDWLTNEIGPVCLRSPGHMDTQVIRPVGGLTKTYTIIIRFHTRHDLECWINSEERKSLIEVVRPLLSKDDDFYIQSGLDFWFMQEGAGAKIPVRWKQFLVTWSVIFPLVLLVPLIVDPLLRYLGIAPNHYFDNLCITGVIVALVIYVVMPHYTKLVERWLFS